ncbi:MAG: hypothetical protein KDC53_19785 [Saprospiraceae bacterium]|nr:hypothetical protein [Saprospiraceae bacterium]
MKKIQLLSLILFGILNTAFSQKSEDNNLHLLLYKGMTLEGKMIELVPGEYVVILTTDGHEIKVPDRKIKRYYYSQDDQDLRTEMTPGHGAYHFKESGFYQYSTLGVIMNTVSNAEGGTVGFEMSISAGHQWSRWVGAGLGAGVDFYRSGASEMSFPLFAEVRGYFFSRPSTPYYLVRSGYGFASANESRINAAKGGWMFNPAVGWRLGDGRGLKMTLDVGLHFQHAGFDYSQGEEQSDVDIVYKRLSMRLGFLF